MPLPVRLIKSNAFYVLEGIAGEEWSLTMNPFASVFNGVEDAAAGTRGEAVAGLVRCLSSNPLDEGLCAALGPIVAVIAVGLVVKELEKPLDVTDLGAVGVATAGLLACKVDRVHSYLTDVLLARTRGFPLQSEGSE